jgi:hypothetical protein
MAYSDFTIKRAEKDFGLTIIEREKLFTPVPETEISEFLRANLEEKTSLALAIGTEKARSELIVADVLLEVRRIFDKQISFFSGIEFNVDSLKGLNGRCDFMLSLSPRQLMLDAPVITVVEAKKEDLVGGLGQCVAEMVAAQIFNEQEGKKLSRIYGMVTSGDDWKFLKLENEKVFIDLDEYQIEHVEKIVGILCAMIRQEA